MGDGKKCIKRVRASNDDDPLQYENGRSNGMRIIIYQLIITWKFKYMLNIF